MGKISKWWQQSYLKIILGALIAVGLFIYLALTRQRARKFGRAEERHDRAQEAHDEALEKIDQQGREEDVEGLKKDLTEWRAPE